MAVATAGLARPAAVPALGARAGIAGTLRSEFTKLRSVRSTYWSLILLVVAGFAWTVADCLGTAHTWPHMAAQAKVGFDATQASVTGVALFGQLVILVLGTLVLTSEYSTGMIRTSLAVMPRRAVLYWSKAAVFAAVSVVIALVTSLAVFLVGQSLLHSTGQSASLSQPGALRAVLLTGFFVALSGAMAYGIGVDVPAAAARQGAADLLVRGCGAMAARRRHPAGHHQLAEPTAEPAHVPRLGRVRGVRRLRGHPARHRRAAVQPS
jgi:ABC-2 type transport system permease protein